MANSRPKLGLLSWFNKSQVSPAISAFENLPRIALVGMPNVGKSVLFNALTGSYVTVSNYPGTTVEISRGEMKLGDLRITVIDTPGMYSLLPITEEQRVARDLLLNTIDFKTMTVRISPELANTKYSHLEGKKLNLPKVSKKALKWHCNKCEWLTSR